MSVVVAGVIAVVTFVIDVAVIIVVMDIVIVIDTSIVIAVLNTNCFVDLQHAFQNENLHKKLCVAGGRKVDI